MTAATETEERSLEERSFELGLDTRRGEKATGTGWLVVPPGEKKSRNNPTYQRGWPYANSMWSGSSFPGASVLPLFLPAPYRTQEPLPQLSEQSLAEEVLSNQASAPYSEFKRLLFSGRTDILDPFVILDKRILPTPSNSMEGNKMLSGSLV